MIWDVLAGTFQLSVQSPVAFVPYVMHSTALACRLKKKSIWILFKFKLQEKKRRKNVLKYIRKYEITEKARQQR